MTPVAVLAATAMHAASLACPTTPPAPVPTVAQIAVCGATRAADLRPGWSITGCYDATADTITLDPDTPRRLIAPTLFHEACGHRAPYLAGDPLWADEARAMRLATIALARTHVRRL